MKRFALHITNYVGYLTACGVLGSLWGRLFGFIFEDFLSDEDYAVEHPKKWILGFFAILILAFISGYLLIKKPLDWLVSKFDKKIDDFADEKEWD